MQKLISTGTQFALFFVVLISFDSVASQEHGELAMVSSQHGERSMAHPPQSTLGELHQRRLEERLEAAERDLAQTRRNLASTQEELRMRSNDHINSLREASNRYLTQLYTNVLLAISCFTIAGISFASTYDDVDSNNVNEGYAITTGMSGLAFLSNGFYNGYVYRDTKRTISEIADQIADPI